MKMSLPLSTPRFSAYETKALPNISIKNSPQITFGEKLESSSQESEETGTIAIWRHEIELLCQGLLEKLNGIQTSTESAKEKQDEAQRALVQQFVDSAKIPTATVTYDFLMGGGVDTHKVADFGDLLKKWQRESNNDFSGVLLNGNSLFNRPNLGSLDLTEMLCKEIKAPFLKSRVMISEEGSHVLKAMLEAADKVAEKQASCVVYLGDYNTFNQALENNLPVLTSILDNYMKNRADLAPEKRPNVILVFEQNYSETSDEMLIGEGRLKQFDIPTFTDFKRVKHAKDLKALMTPLFNQYNIQIKDDEFNRLASLTSGKSEAEIIAILGQVVTRASFKRHSNVQVEALKPIVVEADLLKDLKT